VTHASHLKMIDLFPAGDVIRVHHFEQEEMAGHRYSSEKKKKNLRIHPETREMGEVARKKKPSFVTREKRKGH